MRIKALDSLRGVAALIVVMHHFVAMYPERPALIKLTPLRLLFAGESAVFVFFVLSGFVLFLALGRTTTMNDVLPFWIKRVFRIYPPFCAAILFSAGLWFVAHPQPIPGLSGYFNEESWNLLPSPGLIAGHLAMTDIHDLNSIDQPMWSLVVELRVSLIFPLLAALVIRDWRLACVGSIVVSEICYHFDNPFSPIGPIDLIHTGQYVYLFVIGATLALKLSSVREFFRGMPPTMRLACWGVALLSFAMTPERFGSLVTALGATLLVALVLGDDPITGMLRKPVAMWLGRVSYSLYLIHVPLMLACVHLLDGLVGPFIALCIAVVLSLTLAGVMYRFVELPSIAAGRYLVNLVRPVPTLTEQRVKQ